MTTKKVDQLCPPLMYSIFGTLVSYSLKMSEQIRLQMC